MFKSLHSNIVAPALIFGVLFFKESLPKIYNSRMAYGRTKLKREWVSFSNFLGWGNVFSLHQRKLWARTTTQLGTAQVLPADQVYVKTQPSPFPWADFVVLRTAIAIGPKHKCRTHFITPLLRLLVKFLPRLSPQTCSCLLLEYVSLRSLALRI